MRRQEEIFNALKQDYHTHTMSNEQVNDMKKQIESAKKETRHPLRSLAAAAAAAAVILTILPNTSGSVAYAMSRIPILAQWVEVVTFRDYQYESSRNNADIRVPEIVPQIPKEDEKQAQTDSPAKQKVQKTADEINREIQSITDQLIREFKENLDPDGRQSMQVSSEVIATTEQYFTLKLNCYQGAGSGAEWNYFYTIHLETGERLQLKDLFTKDSDYITLISEEIKRQMKDRMAKDDNAIYWVDNDDMPELNFKAITEETQFYLNENEEVVICFNEGDVAPMYMGCVEFTIPKDVLSAVRQ
ncbi:MAG: DUF3298 domain-containing protein [Eubacterium sp.]|nr:DUF3298 domain-containing protein [Eubacterium sp.]